MFGLTPLTATYTIENEYAWSVCATSREFARCAILCNKITAMSFLAELDPFTYPDQLSEWLFYVKQRSTGVRQGGNKKAPLPSFGSTPLGPRYVWQPLHIFKMIPLEILKVMYCMCTQSLPNSPQVKSNLNIAQKMSVLCFEPPHGKTIYYRKSVRKYYKKKQNTTIVRLRLFTA